MVTIESTDFRADGQAPKVDSTQIQLEVVMSRIDVVSLVGSAVPAELRSDGYMACWLLMVDGQPKAGPFASREAALACQAVWLLSTAAGDEGAALLA